MTNNTIFDDVFRTMAQKMPQLLIPLINEVFGTDYREDEKFQQLRNEYLEENGKIITDSIIIIRNKTYHIECQSDDDRTMAIRMVEYDFAIALEQASKYGRMYEMNFPESCVLYIRHTENTPDRLRVKVNLPNQSSFIYETKTIKVQTYTKDEIFQKKLLLFLPFYVLRYEKVVKEIAENSEKLLDLLKEYESIRIHLEHTLLEQEKSVLYSDLISLIIEISDYIFRTEHGVKKKVGAVMGGKVLELESERLMRIGRAEGKAEGESILAALITQLLALGRTADVELAAKDEEARKRFYKEFGMID